MALPWIFDTPGPPADARYTYGRYPQQFVELRLPSGPTSGLIPTVVVIHGGFWLADYDLEHITHLCGRLAEVGIATWCLEYRRLGNVGGGFPGTFHDVGAAVDLLRDVAPEHGLDLDGLTALGHSAGGHLALWAASRRAGVGLEADQGTDPVSVRRVVSLAGMGDLRAAFELGLCHDVIRHLMGGAPDAEDSRYALASPADVLPLGATQLLFQGATDRWVPLQLSESYAAAAGQAGDGVDLHVFEDVGHFELIDPESEPWKTIETALTTGFRQGLGGETPR